MTDGVLKENARFAQMLTARLGELEVTSLLDGFIETPLSVFDGPDKNSFPTFLGEAGLSGPSMQTAVSCFLIRDDNRNILIDTGMGHLGGQTLGHLVESLALAGVKPCDITDVVLTHLHRDHCGGLIDVAGDTVYTQANIYVNRKEFDYWTSPVEFERAPANIKRFFEPAQTAMTACSRNLQLFDHDYQLTPRLSLVALAGHTTGHTGIRFADAADELYLWGDIIHCAALQMPSPTSFVSFDTDPQMAVATRQSILARAAQENFWICGAHLPFPSIGKIEKRGVNSYNFQPRF